MVCKVYVRENVFPKSFEYCLKCLFSLLFAMYVSCLRKICTKSRLKLLLLKTVILLEELGKAEAGEGDGRCMCVETSFVRSTSFEI